MAASEFSHILGALVVLTLVIGAPLAFQYTWAPFAEALFFAAIILTVTVGTKKLIAYALDADVKHETWKVSQYWFGTEHRFKKEVPAGIILSLLGTLIGLLIFRVPAYITALLTYETKARKVRAAKRFGYNSYTEMTEWHNGLIGAAGIAATRLLAVIAYFLPYNLEYLAKMAAYYTFWNMLPLSKLDGAQIFFGSRVLYAILGVLTLILTAYALLL